MYPFQASFKVNVRNKGQRTTAETSLDPVSDGVSPYVWAGRADITTPANIGGVPRAPLFEWVDFVGQYETIYKGQTLYLNNNTTDNEQSAIVSSFNPISRVITLETSFGSSFDATADTGLIPNVDDASHIFMYMDAQTFPDQFVGQYLYNITINEYRVISKYNSDFQMITLETPFGGTWSPQNQYTIVKDISTSNGSIFDITRFTTTTVILPPAESSVDDVYKGQYIKFMQLIDSNGEFLTYTRLITGYNGTTKVVTFYPPIELTFIVLLEIEYTITPFTEDIGFLS